MRIRFAGSGQGVRRGPSQGLSGFPAIAEAMAREQRRLVRLGQQLDWFEKRLRVLKPAGSLPPSFSQFAADVVDSPAANPDGLFHREQGFAQEADAVARYALGLTDEKPGSTALGLDSGRVRAFVSRFLSANKLTIVRTEGPKNPALQRSTAQPATANTWRDDDAPISTNADDDGCSGFARALRFRNC